MIAYGLATAAAAAVAAPLPARPGPGAAARLQALHDEQRLLAGHLLRRLGFGPNRREMHEVLRVGPAAYIESQLHPESIDDRLGEHRFHPVPAAEGDGSEWQLRWLTRMAYSRRQLQEKMALIWHEHFANAESKVGSYDLMRDQEQLLRARGLGNFRDLLVAITIDNAMLIYLDNAYNDGQATDDAGNPIPPNENYARELLQLFSLGVHRLNLDGSLVLGTDGTPLPAYTENDVREVARALTGWYPGYPSDTDPENPIEVIPPASFDPGAHDAGEKHVLGEVIPADNEDGTRDVGRVADILMAQPSMAPFIAKELVQKLATETPSPGYVERVATVFAGTHGDLRATVRAILTDAEFWSAAVIRTQPKEPIEHLVGAVRGLDARTQGNTLYYATALTGQLVYFPPSVFSFYRPGQKDALVNAAYVATRDAMTDVIANGYVDEYFDAQWDAADLIRRYRLSGRPDRAVTVLARDLFAAPPSDGLRAVLVDYLGPRVTEETLRGAAWLLLCAPEYQVN